MKLVGKNLFFILVILLSHVVQRKNCDYAVLPPGELSAEIPADDKSRGVVAATTDEVHAGVCKQEGTTPLRVVSYKWEHGVDVVTYFVKFEFFGKFWVAKIVQVIPQKPHALEIRQLQTEHQEIHAF